MSEREIDTDRVDDYVLALLYLGLHDMDRSGEHARAWKGFDWDAMDRLHAKGMIGDPVGKAKSVVLTKEGLRHCEELFWRFFAKRQEA
jgi:Domain of unknown function (DUF6429)